MNITELLPWLNLLLVPTVRMLWTISNEISAHRERLNALERHRQQQHA